MIYRKNNLRKKNLVKIGWVCISVLLVILFMFSGQIYPATAQVEELSITLSPAAGTITGCGTTTVEIWLNEVVDFYGADVRLSFDPTVLQVVDSNPGQAGVQIEVGEFWVPGFTIFNTADNTAGTINYVATQLSPTPEVSGSGVILKITFNAISTGSSALSFTYTKISNRFGVEIVAPPTDGSLSTTAPASPTLAVNKLNSTDLRLSWNAIAEPDVQYRLYRDTAPYFTPSAPAFQTTSSTSYDDLGALGNPATNDYYVLRAECESGFQSGNTNRVGEFDFAIEAAPSAVGIYNALALPLDTEGEFGALGYDYDARGLMNYIGSSVEQVLRLNPGRRDFDTWYSLDFGFVDGIFTSDPYPLDIGGSYWVLVDNTAPSVVSLYGDVPAAGSVSFSFVGTTPCSYNSISIPLDQSGITNAAELAADMGDIDQVLRLNPVRQNFDTWYVGTGFGFINGVFTFDPADFPVEIGYPYWVCVMIAGDGKVWPGP